jgi:enoyl-CoA hydratase
MSYSSLIVERLTNVMLITLNRPEALNALNNQMMDELSIVLNKCEADDDIRAIILTGGEKAFAVGADIKEIADKDYTELYQDDFIEKKWEAVNRCRKPVIAAVGGYALGGGCELAMMCDFIIAADNAKFGQPEINIGVLPGAGGTQRLTRLIGKSKAMDMILTGRMMDADEAERSGLVSRIVSEASLRDEAIKTAEKITTMSLPATMLAKECVNEAYESTLDAGVRFERRIFQSLFGSIDQKEGMSAFIEKRTANFKHK